MFRVRRTVLRNGLTVDHNLWRINDRFNVVYSLLSEISFSKEVKMIIDIIDRETIEVYGETYELAHENSIRFIKMVVGHERWVSCSGQLFGSMDKAKRYKVRIKTIALENLHPTTADTQN